MDESTDDKQDSVRELDVSLGVPQGATHEEMAKFLSQACGYGAKLPESIEIKPDPLQQVGKNHLFEWLVIAGLLLSTNVAVFLFFAALHDARQPAGRDVLPRQQQAALKSALDNAISNYIAEGKTVDEARAYYNFEGATPGSRRTMLGRLELLEPYLDEEAYAHFFANSSASQIRSSAMVKRGQYVEFEFWQPPSADQRSIYPKVKLSTGEPPPPDKPKILKRLIAAISLAGFFLALLVFLHRGGRSGISLFKTLTGIALVAILFAILCYVQSSSYGVQD